MAKPETKTYVLELKDGGIRKITIPTTWKLTFGNVVPFDRGAPGHGGRVALRIYEGTKENLRAVMTDVVSVRDISITILEKRTSVQRKAAQKRTDKGLKDVIVEARMTEWVDPDSEEGDEAPNEFLRLSGSVDDEDLD